MRCPALADLPPPPDGKTGWPWTEESLPVPPRRTDGSAWPRISVVTPSYNQGEFIEETIRSILLQGYPGLEYFVVDGGSSDGSVEIIRKYQSWLTWWASKKDEGQTDAINRGLQKSSGALFNWINSDDMLLPNALFHIASAFRGNPVAAPILAGSSTSSSQMLLNRRLSTAALVKGKTYFSQPGLWLVCAKVRETGLNARMQFAFDYEMIVRYLNRYPNVDYISKTVAFFRVHERSKSVHSPEMFRREIIRALSDLVHTGESPHDRRMCRKLLRRKIWYKYLLQCLDQTVPAKRAALTVTLLALRRPTERLNRFWFGAVRRILLDPSRRTRRLPE
jgi:glycosyltransferase involved in cell wall biosynthesis